MMMIDDVFKRCYLFTFLGIFLGAKTLFNMQAPIKYFSQKILVYEIKI